MTFAVPIEPTKTQVMKKQRVMILVDKQVARRCWEALHRWDGGKYRRTYTCIICQESASNRHRIKHVAVCPVPKLGERL